MAKVCFFRLGATPLFIPNSSDVFGGAEVRAFTFAQALARDSKHDVAFAVRAEAKLPDRRCGIEVRAIPRRKGTVRKWFASIHRRVSARPLRYEHFARIAADVIACFGVHDPTANVIEAARRSASHTMLFLTSSEDVSVDLEGTAKQRRHRGNHHYALRHADEIVAQTETQQRELLQRFGRTSLLIRNPIEIRTRSDIDLTPRHALWVGRADRDSKRADICFSIARQCPEIPFMVVMNDTSPDVSEELARALPHNVTLRRHVPLDQIESLFATARLLVNTSASEGFPNTFLQAAKYGVPIVSLRVDPDGMLTERGCGAVAGNEANLVKLVAELYAGGEATARMSQAARGYVVSHHELTARTQELAQAISALSSRRKTV